MVDHPTLDLLELFDQTVEIEPHRRREQQELAAQTLRQMDIAIKAQTLGAPGNTVEVTLHLFKPLAYYHSNDALTELGMDEEASELVNGQYSDWYCGEVRRAMIAKLHHLVYEALFEDIRQLGGDQTELFSANRSLQPDLFDNLTSDEEFDDGIPF